MQKLNSLYSRKNTLAIAKIAIIVLAVLSPFLINFSVSASPADPDTACTTNTVHLNRNLVTDGDVLVTGQYKIPYTSIPTVPASSTFLFELIGTNGTTLLGYNKPFVYFDNGYNDGVFSLYFDSTHAPVWGNPYTIRITENPSLFATPLKWDFVLPSTAYSTLSSQIDNQAELTDQCITLAQNMEEIRSVNLVTSSNGNVLTTVGESYFRGAIPSLQAMLGEPVSSSGLFLIQNAPVDLVSTNWTTEKFDAYENRFDGTWVGTDINNTGTQIGITPTMVMSVFVILPICLAFIIFASIKFKRAEPGYLVCALMLIMGVLLGWMPRAVFASIYQLCGIYIAYLIFYARG
jgi:hypothetical protein